MKLEQDGGATYPVSIQFFSGWLLSGNKINMILNLISIVRLVSTLLRVENRVQIDQRVREIIILGLISKILLYTFTTNLIHPGRLCFHLIQTYNSFHS